MDVTYHKLTILALQKLGLSCLNAHDAQYNVKILVKLAKKLLTQHDLMSTQKTFMDVINYLNIKKLSLSNKHTFLPLKKIILKGMLQRLFEANFSYFFDLVNKFKENEEKAINLLEGKVNGSAIIIKKKKILLLILSHLKSVGESTST